MLEVGETEGVIADGCGMSDVRSALCVLKFELIRFSRRRVVALRRCDVREEQGIQCDHWYWSSSLAMILNRFSVNNKPIS